MDVQDKYLDIFCTSFVQTKEPFTNSYCCPNKSPDMFYNKFKGKIPSFKHQGSKNQMIWWTETPCGDDRGTCNSSDEEEEFEFSEPMVSDPVSTQDLFHWSNKLFLII
jgi:hypothetical protein